MNHTNPYHAISYKQNYKADWKNNTKKLGNFTNKGSSFHKNRQVNVVPITIKN